MTRRAPSACPRCDLDSFALAALISGRSPRPGSQAARPACGGERRHPHTRRSRRSAIRRQYARLYCARRPLFILNNSVGGVASAFGVLEDDLPPTPPSSSVQRKYSAASMPTARPTMILPVKVNLSMSRLALTCRSGPPAFLDSTPSGRPASAEHLGELALTVRASRRRAGTIVQPEGSARGPLVAGEEQCFQATTARLHKTGSRFKSALWAVADVSAR